jgi:hypothetical protein
MFRNSEDISDNAEWQLREELTAGKAISVEIADFRLLIGTEPPARILSLPKSEISNLKSALF